MNRKQQQIIYQKKYRSDHDNWPLIHAREIARQAVERGTIKKQPCAICDHENSEIHHSDYSAPFKVEWLCRKHHVQKHHGFNHAVLLKKINYLLTEQQIKLLKILAKKSGLTVSDLIRRAVDEYLTKDKKP